MTTAELDFPPIEAPPLPEPPAPPKPPAAVATTSTSLAPLSIKDTVLAQFKTAEVSVTELADKYRSVAYDCTTTKGMAEAKAARADLRDNGRLALTKTEARVKAEVNDLKRVMSAEVERLVAIVQPVEDAVDAQIKAEEKRKADEKAERERLAAERKAQFDAAIDKIRRYLTLAQQPDMTAARIQAGIDMLAAQTYGPEWAEFAVLAANAQCETLEGMRKAHAAAVAREAENARLEAQRAENERLAAELAEQQRQQAEAAAELQRQQEELAAAQAALQAQQAAAQVQVASQPEGVAPVAQDRVAENPVQQQAGIVPAPVDAAAEGAGVEAAPTAVDTPAASGVAAQVEPPAIGNPPFTAPAAVVAIQPVTTLADCRAVLAVALDMCDELICKPPTKKQAVALLARVAYLRDLGGLPRDGAAS